MQENIMIVASDNHERFNEASSPTWQQQLSSAIRDPHALCKRLGLKSEWLSGAHTGHTLFETCVPEAYLSRITYGDTSDPLLRQVLPVSDEALTPSGYVFDPLEEADHRPAKGLIHKYAGRVLLIASPNCAINCRYCFRRHFPYSDNSPSRAQWQDA
ncbi:MAG: EF-P beta-lysylation protein EpmB, partial [Halomonas sp.]